ncbi:MULTISPECIES: glutamate synthase large subunit [Psychrilyobacter]|uniref:glutamate synthase (NADPH) n=1 Tax=Psychrilyobacter piezotolerans TaxID=2293438 RepID=A0ABX9KFB0_9FUSO|nr:MULTISPECIES: glutamate synthase large subunit [Psychrilyobacter]MCS5420905.1 glutamate synthase large subunit [Psychrilyobacter sp. S5]NDI78534.1 glutamate synthase large subunit [Psychrilyobacter piezotolerans]RDE60459.1 glutamate synthase large subunit [Psychrilyobacter sp. S5]REI40489.1 glutamate synthase large subunit [Psychrilyobacter piezotolerans]
MKEHSNCGIGVVADINNIPQHQIVREGIKILNRLEHRGGTLRDGSGDGAGLLVQIPREFFKEKTGIDGDYHVAMTFLPKNEILRKTCIDIILEEASSAGAFILAEREVPVKEEILGSSARKSLPYIYQYFIEIPQSKNNFSAYTLRRNIEKRISAEGIFKKDFYFASFSNKTVVYKGLITPKQFNDFYTDLSEESFKSAYVMIHQRFSTNTLPSWDLAQPFRILEHNGEINTINGNTAWIEARKNDTYSKEYLKDEIENIFPLTGSENSDSANLDSVVEFMMYTGKKLPEIVTTLVPQAWEKNNNLEKNLKEYYEAKSLVMEPWDGPAGLITSNGDEIFASLDRNGLRPMRYTITTDNKLIISSEMGVLDTDFSKIACSGKLSAGEFLHLDLIEKKLLTRNEIIERIISTTDYTEEIKNLKKYSRAEEMKAHMEIGEIENLLDRYSYTKEDIDMSIEHLAIEGKEMVASTNYDAPLAVLDEKNPRLFFDYFKQKFAQVTNPPTDSIREKSIFSITSHFGGRKNILDSTEDRGIIHQFTSPIVENKYISGLKKQNSAVISTAFEKNMEKSLKEIVENALSKAKENKNIILTDRGSKRSIPTLLAISAVHHALVKAGLRGRIGLAAESGEIREITHYALLIGYGADLVNPYLVLEYLAVKELDTAKYLKAVDDGIQKIMSKMGISSIASYRGAKIFEGIGLSRELCSKYMGNTSSDLDGLNIEDIEKEVILREEAGYSHRKSIGEFISLKNGLAHKNSYDMVKKLQEAISSKDYMKYKEYSDSFHRVKGTLRDHFNLKNNPIPLWEVESEEDILKRFVAGAMSFGALSKEAHETIAMAFNSIGAMSNSGEGGEDNDRLRDNRISQVKQVASGRFGVTTNYLMHARELQIKMAQGAKPGEGGHLPGHKVSEIIGKVRNTVPGTDLISPPPHHDIYSIEDLAQLIFDLKNLNTDARVSVKLASEKGVGIIASGTVKAGADKVVISGSDGGTGAAVSSSMKFAATPWELGLSDTHKVLCENDLRDLVKLQVDGGIKTGYDIVVAALLGADEYAFGSGLLVAEGCIFCRRCHTNSCPVGITTQKEELRKKFTGSVEDIIIYLKFIASEIRELLGSIGAKSLEEIIGRSSLLSSDLGSGYKKSKLNFDPIFREVRSQKEYCGNINTVDHLNEVICQNSNHGNLEYHGIIDNTNRSFGTTIAGKAQLEAFENNGKTNLNINLRGYSGQSFGAFAVKGQKITLEGYGNDYVAKGLSGGTIIIKKPQEADYPSDMGCIAGNTVLYGATGGELYLNGSAGERFAVRNSGASAVVEGIGNHGCEYMTGGHVVILGNTGNNFGAGMSGGTAYLLKEKFLEGNINMDMVECFDINEKDLGILEDLLKKHLEYTESEIAENILKKGFKNNFIKIASKRYLEKTRNI